MKLPKPKLKAPAQHLFNSMKSNIAIGFSEVQEIPASILLWGPNPNDKSKISNLRLELRKDLISKGNVAKFSEELIQRNQLSTRIQQLIHAQHFDLIISFPTSPGAIAEIHDFSLDSRINRKLMVFLDQKYDFGYGNQSLNAICSVETFRIEVYKGNKDIPRIKRIIYKAVQTIKEMKYINPSKDNGN